MTVESASFFASFNYNFGGQFISRTFSFGINFYLLRVVNKEVLGIANVRLTLLYTTILFLVREPFRKSCLERKSAAENDGKSETKEELVQLVKLLWLCPLVSLAIGALLAVIWRYCLSLPQAELISDYYEGILLFWLAAFIETLAEPLWIISQKFHLIRFVAIAQSVQVFLQRILVALFFVCYKGVGLRAFSFAMVISSSIYTFLFYYRFYRSISRDRHKQKSERELPFEVIRDVLPRFDRVTIQWDRVRLVRSFFWHSVVKQILTDGAQYVMTFFDVISFGEQGIYDAIEKLGSLVARILLAPLEESAYIYFAQNIVRDQPADKQDKDRVLVATRVLCGLLRCVSVVGLTVCVFGFAYSHLALALYGGDLLSTGSGPNMLRTYCVYIFLLAANGITECFSFAAMGQQEVVRHQYWLMLLSVVYILAQIILSHFIGGVGFILANCVNMIIRILFSLRFIDTFYRPLTSAPGRRFEFASSPLWHLWPNTSVLIALTLSFFFTLLSELIFCCHGLSNTAAHVSVGGMALVFTLFAIYNYDFELVNFVLAFLKPRTSPEKKLN